MNRLPEEFLSAMQPNRSGFRLRLLLLLLAIFLALFVAIVWESGKDYEERRKWASEDLLQHAQIIAAHQQWIVADAGAIISGMALHPAIRHPDDIEACSSALAERLRGNDKFTFFALVTPQGELLCASPMPTQPVSFSDREWLRSALGADRMIISDTMIKGRVTGKSAIAFAKALRGEDGRPVAVIVLALDLAWLEKELASAGLPEGTRMVVVDAAGVVALRYPDDPDHLVGRSIADSPLYKAIQGAGDQGVVDAVGLDGVKRLNAFLPLLETPTGRLTMWIGQPEDIVVAPAKRAMWGNIGGALILALIIMGIVYRAAERFFVHPFFGALEESERLLRATIVAAQDAVIVLDDEGRVRIWNAVAERMFGYRSDEVMGREIHPLIVPERFRDAHVAGIRRLKGSGDQGIPNRTMVLTALRKGGAEFPIELSLSAVRPMDGWAVIGIARDISERKRTEDEMRVAAVAFQAREGMMVTDAGGVILRVNEAFTAVTGYGAEEVVGKSPAVLRSGRHDAAFYRTMWEAVAREGRWEGEVWNKRKDGGIYPEWLSISAIRNTDGQITHYLGTFSDISEPREAERKILELAFYDSLTGLPNRRLLQDRLTQAWSASDRSNKFSAILLLDLDHFKQINDTRGHEVGDELLIEVARRLRIVLRDTDSAARLGGDEFVVLLEGVGTDAASAAHVAEVVAEKLRTAIEAAVVIHDEEHHPTASIGVTLFRERTGNIDTLMKQADLALYRAKEAGRNSVRFFSPEMQTMVDARAAIEIGLRHALAKDELVLYYQPQMDDRGRVIGAEALLRWQPKGREMVSPATFIPVAEETGLIVAIGQWVLQAACQRLADWAKKPETRDLVLAVNISARQFRRVDFAERVQDLLERSGANPARLRLELTESIVLHDVNKVIETMHRIARLGVSFSLDDFGTGYSSLAYLKKLPLHELKIDQSFVRDILSDANDRAIVQSVIGLGKSLGLQVIAEGVETEAQHIALANGGCSFFQGYLFGRPSPAEDFEQLAGLSRR